MGDRSDEDCGNGRRLTTRRDFLRTALTAVPAFALLAEFAAAETTAPRESAIGRWIQRQQEIARALASGEIAPTGWQSAVEALARDIDLAQLMAEIERSKIKPAAGGRATDPVRRSVRFLDEAGAPRKLRYKTVLFTFGRADIITPHAHRHMVSAHLVIEGAFRVRNFDRVRDEDGAIVIRPTGDAILGPGAVSTMSVDRDNVHWFVPRTDRAATFDVIVSGLDKGQPAHLIEAVDPIRGTELADGTLRAPILSVEESSRFYTPDV